jgi:hypothetical protein
MRLKSELYKNEQFELITKVILILELDNDNSITLYDLDKDKNKQNKLLQLIPDIRKYFSYACIKGVREPEKVKRPYLSIIKHLAKRQYNIYNLDCKIIIDNKKIRTIKYFFNKIT